MPDFRSDLQVIYKRALDAVNPSRVLTKKLRRSGGILFIDDREYSLSTFRKIFVIGAGKASLAMSQALLGILGDRVTSGIVATRDLPRDFKPLPGIKVRQTGHPNPDARGVATSEEIIEFLKDEVSPKDLLILLVSGGGSALLPAPVGGITLSEKQEVTSLLINCGASISEINIIRKHLSKLKGGRILEYTNRATLLCLMISDVVGDDLSSIASGLTAPDPSSFSDCLAIFKKYRLLGRTPPGVLKHIRRNISADINSQETLRGSDPRFKQVHNVILANNRLALEAAAETAIELGYTSHILSSSVQGDVGKLVERTLHLTNSIIKNGSPFKPPCCVLSGGEITVKVTGDGKGGRNQEFALRCIKALDRWKGKDLLLASIGTDGSDGPTEAAGALVTPTSAGRALKKGLDVESYLERNDAYHFFQALGDLILTGPTGTNVMDLHISLFR